MANPPAEPGRIELQIRRTPGGLGTDGWIFKNLAVGDTVRLSGPYGRFFLREARTEPAILIGGGTGLAPLKSIVRHVLESGPAAAPLPLSGRPDRRPTSTTWSSSARLEAEHPEQFTYRPCLAPTSSGTGRRAWSPTWSPPTSRPVAGTPPTCAGPPPMVEAALKTLMRKRLFPKDIFREDFFDASDKATGGVRSPLLKA